MSDSPDDPGRILGTSPHLTEVEAAAIADDRRTGNSPACRDTPQGQDRIPGYSRNFLESMKAEWESAFGCKDALQGQPSAAAAGGADRPDDRNEARENQARWDAAFARYRERPDAVLHSGVKHGHGGLVRSFANTWSGSYEVHLRFGLDIKRALVERPELAIVVRDAFAKFIEEYTAKFVDLMAAGAIPPPPPFGGSATTAAPKCDPAQPRPEQARDDAAGLVPLPAKAEPTRTVPPLPGRALRSF